MSYYNDQYLAHYGVLGMKWGVRKQRKELKAEKKAHKRAIKDADSKEARAQAKAKYKEFKRGGRSKGQRVADALFANSTDVRAYMKQGKSHGEAFLRSWADNAITYGAISALASVGKQAVTRVAAKKVGRVFSVEELRAMGISTFEPQRFNVDRVKINRTGF